MKISIIALSILAFSSSARAGVLESLLGQWELKCNSLPPKFGASERGLLEFTQDNHMKYTVEAFASKNCSGTPNLTVELSGSFQVKDGKESIHSIDYDLKKIEFVTEEGRIPSQDDETGPIQQIFSIQGTSLYFGLKEENSDARPTKLDMVERYERKAP